MLSESCFMIVESTVLDTFIMIYFTIIIITRINEYSIWLKKNERNGWKWLTQYEKNERKSQTRQVISEIVIWLYDDDIS